MPSWLATPNTQGHGPIYFHFPHHISYVDRHKGTTSPCSPTNSSYLPSRHKVQWPRRKVCLQLQLQPGGARARSLTQHKSLHFANHSSKFCKIQSHLICTNKYFFRVRILYIWKRRQPHAIVSKDGSNFIDKIGDHQTRCLKNSMGFIKNVKNLNESGHRVRRHHL